jgi:hypothetical protein
MRLLKEELMPLGFGIDNQMFHGEFFGSLGWRSGLFAGKAKRWMPLNGWYFTCFSMSAYAAFLLSIAALEICVQTLEYLIVRH